MVSPLFATPARDIACFAGAAAALTVTALAAVLIPIRRAATTDPALVLRGD